jgi:hypothetical protein
MENLKDLIEKIKSDKELRPYFFDFICKNLVMGISETHALNSVDRTRIQKEFYASLHSLSEQLDKNVHHEPLQPIIEEVCKYYLGKVGRIGFDRSPN